MDGRTDPNYRKASLLKININATYENLILNDDTATMPTEAEVNAKIQELKDAETANQNARTTGKAKLKIGEALTDAEIKALFGDN